MYASPNCLIIGKDNKHKLKAELLNHTVTELENKHKNHTIHMAYAF